MEVETSPETTESSLSGLESKEVKSNSWNNVFPSLHGHDQSPTPKLLTVGSSLPQGKDKCVLDKKRQRIKSPNEELDLKSKFDWIVRKRTEEKETSQHGSGYSKTTTHSLSSSEATSSEATRSSIMPEVKTAKEGKHALDGARLTQKPLKCHPEIKENETQCKSLDKPSDTVEIRTLNQKRTDEETLMKLVSCNPFKHSIQALKAIRGMTFEKEKISSSTPNETSNTAKIIGGRNENPTFLCSDKQLSKTIILPKITDARIVGVNFDTINDQIKKNRSGPTKTSNDKTLLTNIDAIKVTTKNDECISIKPDRNSPTLSDEHKVLQTLPPFVENDAKHSSNVDDVQRNKTEPLDIPKLGEVTSNCKTSSQTSASRHEICYSGIREKLTKHQRKKVTRSAKCSNQTHVQGLLNSKVQSRTKEASTNKQYLSEKDKQNQNMKQEQRRSLKVSDSMPIKNRKPKEKHSLEGGDEARIQTNREDSVVLRTVEKKGNENQKETCKTEANIETGKGLLDVVVKRDIDKQIFHPKKRWAIHFLDVEETGIGKNYTTTQMIQGEKRDEKEQVRRGKSEIETKQSSKCFFKTDVPPEQPNHKEKYTEIFLLKDVNVDHEEVVDEKCPNDISSVVFSDLPVSPKKTDSFVENISKSDSSTITDFPSDDDLISKYELDQDQPTNKCSTALEPESMFNRPKKDVRTSGTDTAEIESQTESVDEVVDVVIISDDDMEILGQMSGDSHDVVCMKKKGKKKKKTNGAKSIKKSKKSKKGKAKMAKSSCSVDNETDENNTAIRIQNVIEEQKRILNILTKTKCAELRSSDKKVHRRRKSVSEKDLRDIEACISRGTAVSTPSQLLENVKQSDDLGRKKGIRIKRGNKEEIKQEGSGVIPSGTNNPVEQSSKKLNPAFGIDTFDIG